VDDHYRGEKLVQWLVSWFNCLLVGRAIKKIAWYNKHKLTAKYISTRLLVMYYGTKVKYRAVFYINKIK